MFAKAKGPVIFTKPNIVLIQRHSVPSCDGNLLIHSTSVYVLLQFPMDGLVDRPPRRKCFCLRNEVLSHYSVSGKKNKAPLVDLELGVLWSFTQQILRS